MKNLDETIKALEYCLNPVDDLYNCNGNCPYIHCCDPNSHDVKEDALYWLKKYKSEQNSLESLYWKMHSAIMQCEENPELTWEELRTMQDKPVWWMHGKVGEWLTIYCVPTLGNSNDHVIYATTCSGVECWIYKKDMDTYKYYRKEIVND